MSNSKSLRSLLMKSDRCVVAPCVYDCASARAVEMVGFPAMMLSGGEVSIAMNGVIDYGFTNLTDLEWITSRISQTSPLPLAADIEDGFGGPLAVYRAAKRMAACGASALQLEDSGDMEESTKLLPRERYYEKVRAALAALEGTDCLLIARTNADPATELDEGIERCRRAIELGAQMTTVVKLSNLKDAAYVASKVARLEDVSGRRRPQRCCRSVRGGHLSARLQFHDDALHPQGGHGWHVGTRQEKLCATGFALHLR